MSLVLDQMTYIRDDIKNNDKLLQAKLHEIEERVNSELRLVHNKIDTSIKNEHDHTEKQYTKKSEFSIVRLAVFGFISLILMMVMGSLIGGVIIK